MTKVLRENINEWFDLGVWKDFLSVIFKTSIYTQKECLQNVYKVEKHNTNYWRKMPHRWQKRGYLFNT